ncbi:MAG TPA: TonB-dependent receptor [Azospirillaceae bacterium]|nr:TonB-dependent receptor [Azospirillaceae bacterium]
MNEVSGFRLALAASVACIAFSPMAGAQETAAAAEGDAGIAEVIVTGQRQAYRGNVPVREIPQSIQVLDNELLADVGVTRLDEALELASGVSRQNNFGGLWDAFAIRGFAGDENFPSGYLVNGFNGGRGYGGPRDSSNVERIEVLKGPNAALFGRGEPGGTVNIVTKKPQFDGVQGSAGISIGSYQTRRIEGDITGPITKNIAVRLNGAVQDAASFRDTIETKKYTASPSVLAQVGERTSVSYELEYVKQEVPFDRGIVAFNGDLDAVPISRFLGEPGDEPNEIDVLGHQAQLQHDFNDEWGVLVGFGYRDTSFTGFSSDAELAAGRQTLGRPTSFLARQRRFRDYDTTNSTIRGELNGAFDTGPLRHTIILGADRDRFEVDTVQLRFRPAAYTTGAPVTAAFNAIDIFNPLYGSLPTPTGRLFDNTEVQKAWGVYVNDQIDVTEKLKLRIGGRYDDFTQNIDDRITGQRPRQSLTKFNPQAGASYEVSDQFTVYGGHGRGFRPNSGLDATNQPFPAETSKSYEVGAKYASDDGALTGTVSLYMMKKNNILTADPVNAGLSIAVGKAESRGVEFDLTGRLPGDIQLYLAYSYTDAEVAKDVIDPNFGRSLLKGDPLINIPKHNANILLFKDFTFGEHVFTVGGGLNHISKRLGETGTDFYLPSYTLTKLHFSYEPTENLKLSFDVNNLFDKAYFASSYSTLWVAPGTPRTYTLRASYSF